MKLTVAHNGKISKYVTCISTTHRTWFRKILGYSSRTFPNEKKETPVDATTLSITEVTLVVSRPCSLSGWFLTFDVSPGLRRRFYLLLALTALPGGQGPSSWRWQGSLSQPLNSRKETTRWYDHHPLPGCEAEGRGGLFFLAEVFKCTFSLPKRKLGL